MKISTLTIEMAANVARLRQDMEKAQKTVDTAMGGISKAIKVASGAFAALGVGVSLSALAGWVRGAIDAADATSKMAQKTGLAVKEVAGMQLAFRQSGVSAEQMVPIMAKLGVAITNGSKALDAMGISSSKADGTLKTTRDVMGEVADKFKGYQDGAAKTAMAVSLFGEEGAKLLPLLNQGADGLAKYDDMARQLGLTMDKETTAAAEQFNDTIDLVGQSTAGVATQVAAKLLPTLNVLAGELLGAVTDTNFLTKASNALSFAFRGLYSIGVGVVEAFKTVGTALGGVGAAIAAVLSGDFGQVKGIISNMASDIGASWAGAGASIQRAWSDTANTTVSDMAAITAAAGTAAPVVQNLAKSHGGAAKATREASEALRERIAAGQSANTAFDEEFKRVEDLRLATEGRIKTAREMLEAIERETALLGLSNVEREKAVALFELERKEVVAGTEAYDAYAQKIQQALDAKATKQAAIDLAEVQTEAFEEAQKKQLEQWKKTASSIEDLLTDSLMQGFENGKSFGDALADSVINTFKTTVASAIAKAITNAILSAMASTQWSNAISSALGGGTGGGVDWLGMAKQAYSAYSSAGTGAAAAAATSTSAGYTGSYAAGSVSQSVGYAVPATGTATGSGVASSTLSSGGYTGYGYMGYAALIVAAVMIAENLYEKGYTRAAVGYGKNGQYGVGQYSSYTADNSLGRSSIYDDSTENINRKIFDGLGMSEKWSDILSGTTRMGALFGRKLKDYGMQANVGGGDVSSVDGYAFYKGGLFRSNKTKSFELDGRDSEMFDSQVQSWIDSTKAMARAMGYSEEAIDSYTGSVKVNFKNADTAAEIAERYAEAQEKLQREMLSAAAGTEITKEAFAVMMQEINASMEAVGISSQGIADVLVSGIMGRMSESEVGAALSEMVIGGIYESIASNYASQIASVFTSQIIQPIFVALAAGVPISQAISQQAIANVVATAQQAAAAMNAIFSDPGFRSAISGIQQAISGISGAIGTVRVPSYRAATSSYNAAADAAARAAEETKKAWQSVADSLLEEIQRIRGEILGATDEAQSYYLAQFAIATAQARAGDRDAAEALPELSRQVLAIAEATAGSLGDLRAVQGSTLASLTETRQILAANYGLTIPQFAVGTNYVPQDMLAMVHKGEAIVPAAYNPANGGAVGGSEDPALRAEVVEMRAVMVAMASSMYRLESTVDRVTNRGNAMRTVAA